MLTLVLTFGLDDSCLNNSCQQICASTSPTNSSCQCFSGYQLAANEFDCQG